MSHCPLSPGHGHRNPLEGLRSLTGVNWETEAKQQSEAFTQNAREEGHLRRNVHCPGGPHS